MATDTQASVTVRGTVTRDEFGLLFIDTDGLLPLTDIGLQDGDEVEVTIRKQEPEDEGHGLMCDCIDCIGAERIDWRP